MLHWDKNRKIDVHKQTPERRFEQADDKFGIINSRSLLERRKLDIPACFAMNPSAVWPKTIVGLMSTPAKLPALETTTLCDWTARSFFVVWINFACRRLTGHAQNNSVTTNVTGRGSLFAWQDIWDNKASHVYFRLRFNLSSSQIKMCVGSFTAYIFAVEVFELPTNCSNGLFYCVAGSICK